MAVWVRVRGRDINDEDVGACGGGENGHAETAAGEAEAGMIVFESTGRGVAGGGEDEHEDRDDGGRYGASAYETHESLRSSAATGLTKEVLSNEGATSMSEPNMATSAASRLMIALRRADRKCARSSCEER